MQINLLPEQFRKRSTQELLQDFQRLILKFVFVWLILGGLWVIFMLKIIGFKQKLIEVEETWKNTRPVLVERDLLIQQKKASNEFLTFLKQHTKRDIFWSEKLTGLSRLVPEEVWFNEISFRKEKKEEQENAFLDILASVGYLKSDEAMLDKMNDFIERLKKDNLFFKDFQNLSLFEITKAQDKEKFMNFKLSLLLKSGALNNEPQK